ncbi:Hypothetical protein HVR_LOCUS620 [uncultured virus]|nr:Hypothetical protein HVR_LOCUS620 [uncultured virus]
MYQRDIPKLPTKITREEFVNEIFNLGHDSNHNYDTMMLAVQVGDYFVDYQGPRTPYIGWKRKEYKKVILPQKKSISQLKRNQQKKIDTRGFTFELSSRDPRYDPHGIADVLSEQIYSKELIHTVTAIAADYNEDRGYDIDDANYNCNNAYVYKLQWEICRILKFHIRPINYLKLIGEILWRDAQAEQERLLTNNYNFSPKTSESVSSPSIIDYPTPPSKTNDCISPTTIWSGSPSTSEIEPSNELNSTYRDIEDITAGPEDLTTRPEQIFDPKEGSKSSKIILSHKHLASTFWDLSKDVCVDYKLSKMNPITVLVGVILLYKHGKLSAVGKNKHRRFLACMKKITRECEASFSEVIQSYIKMKRG